VFVPASAADNSHNRARRDILAGLVANGGGRRAFVDATGNWVTMPPAIRRLVATDNEVSALLRSLGAPLIGCTGVDGGVVVVGMPRAPDPQAVAQLRPDLIVTGAVDRVHDLVNLALVDMLRRVAPVIAVETGRPAVAVADLRALLGVAVGGTRPATRPVSNERVGAP
jgi:ABC-type Fe3+-hydroxamate transport system substrate-binding protein